MNQGSANAHLFLGIIALLAALLLQQRDSANQLVIKQLKADLSDCHGYLTEVHGYER